MYVKPSNTSAAAKRKALWVNAQTKIAADNRAAMRKVAGK